MQILVSRFAGYCGGVQRAVEIAKEAGRAFGKVFTLGDLIHNKRAVEELKAFGVYPVYDVDDLKEGDVCVLRSHGAGEQTRAQLQEKKVTVIDATCPSVAKIHQEVALRVKQGAYIIVVGKEGHPEVLGIKEALPKVSVLESADSFAFPPNEDFYFVVAQTTLEPGLYQIFKENFRIKAKNHAKTVEFLDSICYTTKGKIEEAEKIAKACSAVFVIGDANSSNTKGLFNVAKKICENTYFVSDLSALQAVKNINSIAKLGILSGASTPQESITEVINRMEQLNNADVVAQDEVNQEVVQVAEEEIAVNAAEAVAEETTIVAEVTATVETITEAVEKPVEVEEEPAESAKTPAESTTEEETA